MVAHATERNKFFRQVARRSGDLVHARAENDAENDVEKVTLPSRAKLVLHSQFMTEFELNLFRVDRLRAAINHISDGNVTIFGKNLGYLDGAYIRQMLSGTRGVGERTTRKIEALPGMVDWFNPSINPSKNTGVLKSKLSDFLIPKISWATAGKFCKNELVNLSDYAEDMVPKPICGASFNSFVLKMRGDSMDAPGGYRDGDALYADPEMVAKPGRDVIVDIDGKLTLRRYKEDDHGPYLLELNGNKLIRLEDTGGICGVVFFTGREC